MQSILAPKGVNVQFIEGCNIENLTNYQQAVAAAQKSDVIIVALGETHYAEIYGDINDLTLNPAQTQYLQMLAATGKPIVLVMVEGRPRLIPWAAANIPAILLSYLPGSEGGQAIAETIFGLNVPSGRLPFTYPQYPNDLVPYWHSAVQVTSPQWEFGFGLSFTTFAYSNLKITPSLATLDQTISISVVVKNTGNFEAKESVLLFVSDLIASISPPVKRLRGFEKVGPLAPGQTANVQFEIVPRKDLTFVNSKHEQVVEPGVFKVVISNLSGTFSVTF